MRFKPARSNIGVLADLSRIIIEQRCLTGNLFHAVTSSN
jgi:hypothetical protein